jgi:hypothetical protein
MQTPDLMELFLSHVGQVSFMFVFGFFDLGMGIFVVVVSGGGVIVVVFLVVVVVVYV